MHFLIAESSVSDLLNSIVQLGQVLFDLVVALGGMIVPWLALIAWVAYWLLAVDWSKLRVQMIRGGFLAVILIGLMTILVWGTVAPPADGAHHMLGLRVSNFVGKTVYVSLLISIMFLCGSVQLSGSVDCFINFPDDTPPPKPHAHAHH